MSDVTTIKFLGRASPTCLFASVKLLDGSCYPLFFKSHLVTGKVY